MSHVRKTLHFFMKEGVLRVTVFFFLGGDTAYLEACHLEAPVVQCSTDRAHFNNEHSKRHSNEVGKVVVAVCSARFLM